MPRRTLLTWAATMAALAHAAALGAASPRVRTEVLALDPAQTRIEFTLSDVLHTVHGTFRLKQGTVRFDPSTGAATGSIVVDATSGESGSKGRDKKMHEKVLESRRYPDVTFTPARIDGPLAPEGQSQVQIHGEFGLHGQEHEITLPATVVVAGDQLTATAHFSVPYVAWGLKNPSTLFLRVSTQVNIDVHAIGHLTAGSAAP